ncbi:putative cytosolic protein [Granulibacter bethesdensis]|uniref:Endoribonuclease YbeY n=2 Tax=Granulibacter bethesdensis TaxID=364410 RepID=A0AAN0VEQ9_9PROT|nr:rRNA maturation RNase YbeY [Granulibacter bethesdensis]AHJ61862.1 putative cytosolic protein [Granulibacter bethesdensis]
MRTHMARRNSAHDQEHGQKSMDPASSPNPASASFAPAGFPSDTDEDGVSPGYIVPEIIVTEPAWRRHIPHADRLIRRVARAAGSTADCVVLSCDRDVRRLNARHRGKDKPTNVLTFEPAGMPGAEGGEIVLALGVVLREAKAARKRPVHHLAHLLVHGVLHLHGHDHHHAGDARRMEAEEARIMRSLGMPNPWKRS